MIYTRYICSKFQPQISRVHASSLDISKMRNERGRVLLTYLKCLQTALNPFTIHNNNHFNIAFLGVARPRVIMHRMERDNVFIIGIHFATEVTNVTDSGFRYFRYLRNCRFVLLKWSPTNDVTNQTSIDINLIVRERDERQSRRRNFCVTFQKYSISYNYVYYVRIFAAMRCFDIYFTKISLGK